MIKTIGEMLNKLRDHGLRMLESEEEQRQRLVREEYDQDLEFRISEWQDALEAQGLTYDA